MESNGLRPGFWWDGLGLRLNWPWQLHTIITWPKQVTIKWQGNFYGQRTTNEKEWEENDAEININVIGSFGGTEIQIQGYPL